MRKVPENLDYLIVLGAHVNGTSIVEGSAIPG